jgi:hypothetical protein
MFLRTKTREKDGKKHRYFVSRMAGSERTIGLFPANTGRSRVLSDRREAAIRDLR